MLPWACSDSWALTHRSRMRTPTSKPAETPVRATTEAAPSDHTTRRSEPSGPANPSTPSLLPVPSATSRKRRPLDHGQGLETVLSEPKLLSSPRTTPKCAPRWRDSLPEHSVAEASRDRRDVDRVAAAPSADADRLTEARRRRAETLPGFPGTSPDQASVGHPPKQAPFQLPPCEQGSNHLRRTEALQRPAGTGAAFTA